MTLKYGFGTIVLELRSDHHACITPLADDLIEFGYLSGTIWVCDYCGQAYKLMDKKGKVPYGENGQFFLDTVYWWHKMVPNQTTPLEQWALERANKKSE